MNIMGLANNYKGMPDDGKVPIIFWKGGSDTYNKHSIIIIPNSFGLVWPEVELAIKIDKTDGHNMYGIAMDITASSPDDRDVHLPTSKSLKTFCPVGDSWVKTYDPDAELTLTVNGRMIQRDYIRNMRYSPEKSLRYVEQYVSLFTNDLIITGTPPHPYYNLNDGDIVEASIEGIGSIKRKVMRL